MTWLQLPLQEGEKSMDLQRENIVTEDMGHIFVVSPGYENKRAKFNRMRMIIVNVPGKGSLTTKII